MKQRKLHTKRAVSQWMYDGTWAGRERHLLYNHSEKGKERVARYEASPRRKAAKMAVRKYGLSLRTIEDAGLLGMYPDVRETLGECR